MADKRHVVVDLQTGRTRPGVLQKPVLSSASTPWEGVLVESYRNAEVDNMEVASPNHVVGVHLRQTVVVEWSGEDGKFISSAVTPGQVSIFPAMVPFSIRARNSGEFMLVELEPKFLYYAAHELVGSNPLELLARRAIDDPLLRSAATTLKRELEAGNPGGKCYGEAIAAAMAVHLVRHYSTRPLTARALRGGLARYQLRRAIDFIQAHLGEDISLQALAQAAGLSVFHFARLFKQSTGLPPHQYVMRCRVEQAKHLLLSGKSTIVEAAFQVGFCDQSHLAVHFKRTYGMTPKEFLRRSGRNGAV